jgi:hypothetical protein
MFFELVFLNSILNQNFENFLPSDAIWTKRILWDADFASRNMILFEFSDEKHKNILYWKEKNNIPKFKIFETHEIDANPSDTDQEYRRHHRSRHFLETEPLF